MNESLPAIVPQQLPAIAGETASSAVAAQSKAMVEARYVIAMRRPRVWDQVRQDILRECRRPSFANNKSAYYKKPIGTGVEGLGIRFVEVALRCMTNVLIEPTMIYEDVQKEIQRVCMTDLESNTTYNMDVRVSKTVERSNPSDDGSYISVRLNKEGRKVYTVEATDDDLLNKRAALVSKAIRTLGLRIIPGDIQDEAEAIIKNTRIDKASADPDGERKRVIDSFAEISVRAADLVEYLGHSIDTCSPAELVGLRATYGAIRDGEATWSAVMDNKREQDGTANVAGKLSPIDAINARVAKAAAKEQLRLAKEQLQREAVPPPTYAEIVDALNRAVTEDDVNDATSLIDGVIKDRTQRDELHAAAKARRKELESKA